MDFQAPDETRQLFHRADFDSMKRLSDEAGMRVKGHRDGQVLFLEARVAEKGVAE